MEFFEDLYENDRTKFAEFQVDGEYHIPIFSGDPLMDELEARLAAGEEIGTEELEELEARHTGRPPGDIEGIEDADLVSDDYSDLTAPRH